MYQDLRCDFFRGMTVIIPHFLNLSHNAKLSAILCPVKSNIVKITNAFLKKLMECRNNIGINVVDSVILSTQQWQIKQEN